MADYYDIVYKGMDIESFHHTTTDEAAIEYAQSRYISYDDLVAWTGDEKRSLGGKPVDPNS